MKRAILVALAFLLLHISLQAQTCGVDGIMLTSQTSVNNFKKSGCTHVLGNLEINSIYTPHDPIINLDSLIVIKQISGGLSIFNNNSLTSLKGLDSLKVVGQRVSIGNNGLLSLTGLHSLRKAYYIQISRSLPMTSLAGLNSLDSLIGFTVDNTSLLDLTGFAPLLDSVSSFNISDHTKLQSLSGLSSNLVYIASLQVRDCKNFSSIGELPASLTSLYNIQISNTPALSSLEGLEYVKKLYGLVVYDVPNVKNLVGLGPVRELGFLQINSIEQLSGLDSLEKAGVMLLTGPLQNFTGLKSIKEVGTIALTNNPQVSFKGLETVDSLLDLSLGHCAIATFAGLDNVRYLYSLSLSNSSVASLTGFENVRHIRAGVQLQKVSGLTNLQGLNKLHTIEDEWLWVSGTLALQIQDMPDLTSLDGLDSLRSVGGLYLASNPNLQSLAGIGNIDPAKLKMVYLQNSGTLTDCNVKSICTYLMQPTNPAFIASNGAGCSTREQIVTSEECLIVFPVELVSFTGMPVVEGNKLRWRTASEVINKGFEIERGNNARSFTKIAFVEGSGNSNQEQQYSYTDSSPFSTTYYRLKQLDFDGKSTYSKIIVLRTGEHAAKVYPNPARGLLNIESEDSNLPFSIKNVQGFTVMESSVLPTKPLDTSSLQSGVYMITVGEKVFRVAVQN
ncbi:T9SS type A sorting domain-containing protein [Dyadobacter sp. CY326]|uniref:T9SS type A sorting domain-containing protein n=1 Tax=Dyadobacter sp. CY326 TaxID=2907300 RepID=UPI001F334F80|nr:T9SS type A sorting domain-containing protein [Dyadobacter sp. CY326]MCE7064326.1 T9SS type A sorting domain-containing protein [Dyadobacter sp. CY326]